MVKRRDTPSTSAGASSTPDRPIPHISKRKPIPRKGHTKSRAGCLVCKRRKVKCDEVTPGCGPCERLGLACRYPGPGTATPTADVTPPDAVVPIPKPIRNELPSFTATDLRFFQHFLFAAYPTLPVGGWNVWQDVSQLAHHYEFLIHAMLGLGASHLGMLNNQGYMKEALNHRVKAIKSLNEFLNQGYKSQAECDAAFGAVLSLTFQSAYIPDGLADFLSMIRGCFVVGIHAIDENSVSRFESMSRDVYVHKVHGLLNASASDAALDVAVIQGFCSSLKSLGPLCESPTDLDYLARIERVAIFAATDPVQAYLENSHLYSNLGDLSNEEFASFSDPERPISRLIIMHLLCLDLVMSRKEVEDGDKDRVEDPGMGSWGYRRNVSAQWIENMHGVLPEEYKTYGQWVNDLSLGFRYSYEGHNETWRPFMLHRGKATMCSTRALENVQEHSDCFEELLQETPYLGNNLDLPLRPPTPG